MARKGIPRAVRAVLAKVKERLLAIYGDEMRALVLFGSYARGDFTVGSDIDLALVLSGTRDRSAERKRYFDEICALDLEHDVVISVIPLGEDAYEKGGSPLILNIRREGVAI
jgi:predicted nucleotidyltransferase